MAGESLRKTRAVIYARISLDRQGSGLGVERQTVDCEGLADSRGWEVVETFADNDISAYSGKVRPGYQALLELMRSGGCDAVVAWHVDRLHRSPTELEEYISVSEASGITTVTVRAGELDLATASGRMVARMLGAAARHESEQKSERVSRRRRQDAESGRAHGPLGYGYDSQQRVVPHEAEVVRDVAGRLLAGESLYRIASDLNDRGVPTPGAGRWYHHHVAAICRADEVGVDAAHSWVGELDANLRSIVVSLSRDVGLSATSATRLVGRAGLAGESSTAIAQGLTLEQPMGAGQVAKLLTAAGVLAPVTTWRAANVRAMIRRGTLCGWRDFGPGGRGGGEMVAPGTWEPILELEQSRKLRTLLDAPERKRTGRERRLLLSSILVCGRCGAPLGGYNSRQEGPKYACSQQPGLARCGRLTIVAPPVDELVVSSVLAVLDDSNVLERQSRSLDTGLSAAEHELAAVRELRQAYAKDAAAGLISRDEWFALRDGLERREHAARRRLGEQRVSPAGRNLDRLVPKLRGPQLRRWWDQLDIKKQRDVLRLLIDRVEVHPASGPTRQFDPSRVSPPVWRA